MLSLLGTHAKAVLTALGRSQAMIEFDTSGKILSANENFCRAMGYSAEQIVGKHHSMFCEPAYAQSADYRTFWKNLGEGKSDARQYKRIANGGREVWIQASYNPIILGGKVKSIVKLATVITEDKAKSAEDSGKLAALSRAQAVIEFTTSGEIITANENFLTCLGYGLHEIRGQHHRMFCDDQFRNSPDYAEFWRKLAAGEFISAEFKRIGKGGKEVWIQASYNPVFDRSGKAIKVVKIASYVTERKIAAADAQSQLNAIGRAQAVIEFNLDGTIITANDNFCRAMGYSLDEIKGRHHRMFVDPAYAQSAEYQAFWDKLRRGESLSAVGNKLRPWGGRPWLQCVGCGQRDRGEPA